MIIITIIIKYIIIINMLFIILNLKLNFNSDYLHSDDCIFKKIFK